MTNYEKLTIFSIISIGFILGFAGSIFPNQKDLLIWASSTSFQIQRLHIFFFNLIAGGTTILWFTKKEINFSKSTWLYLITSFIYALSAFLNLYTISLISGILLIVIVERVRIKYFGIFPNAFFDYKVSVGKKFHLASILCLSIGIFLAQLTILNNYFIKIISPDILPLNYFYLGFSFPLSLIIFSIIYNLIDSNSTTSLRLQKEVGFWLVNLGVIIFFVFIIFKIVIGELVCASILIIYIFFTFYLFIKNSQYLENKKFLLSGLLFLTITSITGVLMIYLQFSYPDTQSYQVLKSFLLQIHGYLALYGWSLSGLIVIIRKLYVNNIFKNNTNIIIHWFLLTLLVPFGIFNYWFALLAAFLFTVYFWKVLVK
ncbi:hypothetical protein Thena_1116 [Thermodesulfobium narugense DSM 14796]|uniref:Uncharacterized protein n=1 Tax=Thermodesulfobium narugense DSM 14796 TaxID=747365 RepID=M1E514_9BACT|nr:hypothetical protein [Thermodesulfobium narugense]AEE14737.1 hypothetical protein Thena_1116 [Thermodesulfobium narugense DSM 14796]